MKTKQHLVSALICTVSLQSSGCKKDDKAMGKDLELLRLAQQVTGSTWYGRSSKAHPRSAGSTHNYSYLRTRYNDVASQFLDSAGKVMQGTVFPDGSLIVKELYDDTNSVGRYAILLKRANDPDADAKGWVWGYVKPDEIVAEPASKKGASCNGCHSQSGNIDYMLMNKYFP